MIICEVNKNHLNIRTRELLTAGSQNVNTVEFRFNEAWDGLAKTATFKTSKKTISVLLNTNTTAIPWEALADAGEILAVGVFGLSGETLVLPTVWGILGKVMDAAHLGDEEKEPTPDVYQKILDELNALERPTWDAVQNKPFTTLGDGLSVDKNGVLSAEGGGSANAVQYVAQTLTDEQKTQARNNIDADKKRIVVEARRSSGGSTMVYYNVDDQNAAIDKFIAEYKAGTEILLRLYNRDYPLTNIDEDGIVYFSGYIYDAANKSVGVIVYKMEKNKAVVEESSLYGIKAISLDDQLKYKGYAADAKAVGNVLGTKLDKNQGTTNAGKILGVGEDGNVVPQDKPSGGSVTVDDALSSISTNPVQNKVVTAALAEKITAPTTASVGQIIKVKSVDGTGKPTEWEAVDMPSGGGGAWTKIHEETLAEAVSSYVYPLDNVKAAAIVVFPGVAVAGVWKRITIGSKNVAVFNNPTQAIDAVYAIADVNEIIKFAGGKCRNVNLATNGANGAQYYPSTTLDGLTEINQIGSTTAELLVAGAKIEIYIKG